MVTEVPASADGAADGGCEGACDSVEVAAGEHAANKSVSAIIETVAKRIVSPHAVERSKYGRRAVYSTRPLLGGDKVDARAGRSSWSGLDLELDSDRLAEQSDVLRLREPGGEVTRLADPCLAEIDLPQTTEGRRGAVCHRWSP